MDLLREGGDIVLEKLAAVLSERLSTQKAPIAWKNASNILIHKNGFTKDLKNYTPMRVACKLLTKVIVNRIGESLDSVQPRVQAGFRKGYATMDPIHVVNQVIQRSTEYIKSLYTVCVDYEKAFDSVQTAAVLKALKDQGIEEIYIRRLADIIRDVQAG